MGTILGFFGASPARLQGLVYAALAVVVLCLGLTSWALVERVRAAEARMETQKAIAETERVRAQLVAAVDQGKILARGLEACNAGVAATKSASDGAIALAHRTLEALAPIAQQHAAASKRLEDLIRQQKPPGAGCKEARAAIAARKSAGAAP